MLTTELGLAAIVQRFHGVRVLVVGDIMLDIDHVGEATRISPEAPVPVLLNPKTEYRLGGAGAVAAMCAALGAQVTLMGVIGADRNQMKVRTLVGPAGVTLAAMVDPARPTITKERICGVASGRHRQQLGRMDYEATEPMSKAIETTFNGHITDALRDDFDIILISDYGKGTCTEKLMLTLSSRTFQVIVDPPKYLDWFDQYYGVSCIVPNRFEAGNCTARQLRDHVESDAIIIKRDVDGCELCHYDQASDEPIESTIPSQARAVYDVTGAGDQFLAMLGCARGIGLGWVASATLANQAAGLQVARHGCVSVTAADLIASPAK